MFSFTTIVIVLAILALQKEFSLAVFMSNQRQPNIIQEDWIPITIDIQTAFNQRTIKLNQHRRDGSSAGKEPLHLSFSGYDREFKLQLVQNDQLIAHDATFFVDGESVKVDRDKFQHGYVEDMNDSNVRMFVDFDDDFVTGIIHLPTENATFIIDRPENMKLHKEPPSGTRMVLLRMVHNVTSNSNIDESSTFERRGLINRLKDSKKGKKSLCDLYIDADMTFYRQWSGINGSEDRRRRRVFERMISYVNEVNSIYEKNFDYFKLHIVGAEVSSDDFIKNANEGSQFLRAYREWLPEKNRKGRQFNKVCLNHLFVHRNTGATQGEGMVSRNRQGGVCDRKVRNSKARNVAFTSTLAIDGTLPYFETIATVAHEIGHNIGAQHDCCLDGSKNSPLPPTPKNCVHRTFCHSGCSTDLYGERFCSRMEALNHQCVNGKHSKDHFLMHPKLNPVGIHNASVGIGSSFKFSRCSKREIVRNLRVSGTCLHAPIKSNRCQMCIDPSLCPCCSNGQLLPSNTLCRQKLNPCLEKNAYCDGVSPFCPAQEKKPDGFYCTNTNNGRKGICREGKCDIPHRDFCAALSSDTIMKPCISEQNQCVKACMVSIGSTSVCMAVSKKCNFESYIKKLKQCPFSDFETPCQLEDGNDGICDGQGTCLRCDGSDCPWN